MNTWDEDARWYVLNMADGTQARLVTAYGVDVAKNRARDVHHCDVLSVAYDGPIDDGKPELSVHAG